ncbi:MAG: hypothetical protein GX556_12285 [Fibrobacter sp.]|nr:hypothetical protein [Fibrobacter sp.]
MYKKRIFAVISLITVFSCAHQMTPGGGPDDKTGPSVHSITPRTGSVNVDKNTEIILTFSEWIASGSERGISIFPPVEFKTKIKGKVLHIQPDELSDSTTYHVEINSSLKDLRGNPVTTPYTLVFSTGPTLDSGVIEGCVTDPSRDLLQPKIALFSEKELADTGLVGPPSYLLQTDSTGRFRFNNIRTGKYRVIGYFDVNNDSRLQAGTEQVFMPQDSMIAIKNQLADIALFPAVFDTAFPRIISLQTSNKLIKGKWNKPFDSLSFNQPEIVIENAKNPSEKITDFKYLLYTNTIGFAIKTAVTAEKTEYRFIYTMSRKNSIGSLRDTVAFNGSDSADTVRPALKRWDSDNARDLRPLLKMIWTEPVLLKDSLLMTGSSGDTVFVSSPESFSDTTTAVMLSDLKPGSSYQMVIFDRSGEDLSGNAIAIKDTSDTAANIVITTPDIDSLATSLQGGAKCLSNRSNIKWVFSHFNGKTYTTDDSSGTFLFSLIPAGEGLIGYFEDRNGNGLQDPGKLVPWIGPEEQMMSPDTVEARARWDIEGLEIPVCEICK